MNYSSARHEAIKNQYNLTATFAAHNLAATSVPVPLVVGFFPSIETLGGYTFKNRTVIPDDQPGFSSYIDIYQNTRIRGITFAVTILQFGDIAQAQDHLVSELSRSMAPSLPRAEEKGIQVGNLSFGGLGDLQTCVRFIQKNLFVKVESVGSTPTSVKEFAEALDRQILAFR